MKVYFDASAIIYGIEGAAPFRQTVISRIDEIENTSNGIILTSRLSRLECRVRPLRRQQAQLLATYDLFFTLECVQLAEITASIIELAAKLRADHGIKTPDAIHIATAIDQRADRILTGDKDFSRCNQIQVEVL